MADYVNFYENIQEASMRLKNTVVLYDGLPYYVLNICDHKSDGIFRVYLEPIGDPDKMEVNSMSNPPPFNAYPPEGSSQGKMMDDWMKANPNSRLLRKQMNSPLFNKFRPFPLGMCNVDGLLAYIERQPTRKVEQGLTQQMLMSHQIRFGANKNMLTVNLLSDSLKATILGDYPDPSLCLEAMKDPSISNEGVGFHREFALVRGPIDMIFLAYKTDIVGVLTEGTFARLKLSKKFIHAKEAISTLHLFKDIVE